MDTLLPFEAPTTPTPPEPAPEDPGFAERAAERLLDVRDSLQIAYRGLRFAVSHLRANYSEGRRAKMDRKNELYSFLGQEARLDLGRPIGYAPTYDSDRRLVDYGDVPRPKTFIEKRIAKKIDGHAQTHADARTMVYRTEKQFGKEHELIGMTPTQKTIAKLALTSAFKRGEMTAREYRIRTIDIDATPLRHGELAHQTHSKAERKARRKLARAANQPVARAWRNNRLDEANRDKRKHNRRKTKHLDKAVAIKKRKQARHEED